MSTQDKYSTPSRAVRNMLLMAGLTLVVVIGAVLTLLTRQAPVPLASAPATIVAPAAVAPVAQPRAVTTNRIFQDEINAAGLQYIDPASIAGPLPERLQDLGRPLAPVVMMPQRRVVTSNRIFADEITAGPEAIDWSAPEAGAILPLHGSR